MENAGVVAMRRRGPRVSRPGRIPFPEDQSEEEFGVSSSCDSCFMFTMIRVCRVVNENDASNS